MTKPNEIYFSVDIEADGGIPARNSMLSFGVAAFMPTGEMIGTFERNLKTLPNAVECRDTMDFWARFPDAWKACRENQIEPSVAMKELDTWVRHTCDMNNGYPVFVSYPASFDFTFIYWYLVNFNGKSVFSFNALDIKSYAMAVLGWKFKKTVKKYFPERWKSKQRHTHVAIDDAIEQGEIFMKMLAENTKAIKERKSQDAAKLLNSMD
jgi:hypothetical protein